MSQGVAAGEMKMQAPGTIEVERGFEREVHVERDVEHHGRRRRGGDDGREDFEIKEVEGSVSSRGMETVVGSERAGSGCSVLLKEKECGS